MTIQVYVVEDHPVMRETIQDYLALDDSIEICGVAEDADEAAAALQALRPSVVLIDLALPGRSGLDLLREVAERWQTPCVIVSGHGERSYVRRALAEGARGYVLKGTPKDVPAAIRAVADGRMFLSPSLAYAPEAPGGP